MKKLIMALVAGAVLPLLIVVGTVNGQNPPPPPPGPGGSGGPPPAPGTQPTATATATATTTPLTVTVRLAHSALAPGKKQTVTVTTAPSAVVRLAVTYPNGKTSRVTRAAGSTGKATWTYTQPAGTIKPSSRTARVAVVVTSTTGTVDAIARYTINFRAIDVTVVPSTVRRGQTVTAWVHTSGKTKVQLTLAVPGIAARTLTGRTGSNGWSQIREVVAARAHTGTARVTARATVRGHRVSAGTTFRVS